MQGVKYPTPSPRLQDALGAGSLQLEGAGWGERGAGDFPAQGWEQAGQGAAGWSFTCRVVCRGPSRVEWERGRTSGWVQEARLQDCRACHWNGLAWGQGAALKAQPPGGASSSCPR